MPRQNISDISKISFDDELNVLNLSDNPLTSLVGMPELPHLVSLDLSNTQLTSFEGIPRLNSLSVLDIRGTPLNKVPTIRITALILFPRLENFNGSKIPFSDKAKAKEYPAQSAFLIRKGWIPPQSPPSDQDLIQISRDLAKDTPKKPTEAPKRIVSQREYLTAILNEQNRKLSS